MESLFFYLVLFNPFTSVGRYIGFTLCKNCSVTNTCVRKTLVLVAEPATGMATKSSRTIFS